MDRNSESFSPGYCEYLVDGYADKTIIGIRAAAIVVGLVLSFFVMLLLMKIPQVFFIWMVVILAFEIILFRLTKREFEYTVAMGEMTVEAIYGRRWRRKLINVRLSDADRVFPIDSVSDRQLISLNADKTIIASPKKSDFLYCLLTKDDGGKNSKTAIVFSSCKKLNDAIRFYNRAAITERK